MDKSRHLPEHKEIRSKAVRYANTLNGQGARGLLGYWYAPYTESGGTLDFRGGIIEYALEFRHLESDMSISIIVFNIKDK